MGLLRIEMDDVARLVVLVVCFWCTVKRVSALPLVREAAEDEDSRPIATIQMGQNLTEIPEGQFTIITANFAYNNIRTLSFYQKFYKNLEQLELSHNRIATVQSETFKELRQLKELDLSYNNLTIIDFASLRQNHKLDKLDLSYNQLIFRADAPFLKSHTVTTLLVSHNRISDVYDVTFARLPNLETLFLDGNPLYYLSSNCFVPLRRVQYLSLANTGVFRLSESMFRNLPRLTDLTNTDLAGKFEPPLRRMRSNQLMKLINIEKYIV